MAISALLLMPLVLPARSGLLILVRGLRCLFLTPSPSVPFFLVLGRLLLLSPSLFVSLLLVFDFLCLVPLFVLNSKKKGMQLFLISCPMVPACGGVGSFAGGSFSMFDRSASFVRRNAARIALASPSLLASAGAFAQTTTASGGIDTTSVASAFASLDTAIGTVGGLIIAAAALAVTYKWVKGMIFG